VNIKTKKTNIVTTKMRKQEGGVYKAWEDNKDVNIKTNFEKGIKNKLVVVKQNGSKRYNWCRVRFGMFAPIQLLKQSKDNCVTRLIE
jgi:hypothetical protein